MAASAEATRAALESAASALSSALSAEDLRQAKYNRSAPTEKLWLTLHELLLRRAAALRRRRYTPGAASKKLSLEGKRFVQTGCYNLGYRRACLLAQDVARIGSRELLMALGWLLHRCGVLTAAETSSQSHSALGACASALAEQDLSRSTDTARQAAAAARLDIRVAPAPAKSPVGNALLACRQAHAVAGQCLQAARTNASLAIARADTLFRYQQEAGQAVDKPHSPSELFLVADEMRLRTISKQLETISADVASLPQKRALWWRWLGSVMKKAEHDAAEDAEAGDAILQSLQQLNEALLAEPRPGPAPAALEKAPPVRPKAFTGAGAALEVGVAFAPPPRRDRRRSQREEQHAPASSISHFLHQYHGWLSNLAEDVSSYNNAVEARLTQARAGLPSAIAHVEGL